MAESTHFKTNAIDLLSKVVIASMPTWITQSYGGSVAQHHTGSHVGKGLHPPLRGTKVPFACSAIVDQVRREGALETESNARYVEKGSHERASTPLMPIPHSCGSFDTE